MEGGSSETLTSFYYNLLCSAPPRLWRERTGAVSLSSGITWRVSITNIPLTQSRTSIPSSYTCFTLSSPISKACASIMKTSNIIGALSGLVGVTGPGDDGQSATSSGTAGLGGSVPSRLNEGSQFSVGQYASRAMHQGCQAFGTQDDASADYTALVKAHFIFGPFSYSPSTIPNLIAGAERCVPGLGRVLSGLDHHSLEYGPHYLTFVTC